VRVLTVLLLAAAAIVAAVLLRSAPDDPPRTAAARPADTPEPEPTAPSAHRRRAPRLVRPARCPRGLAGCREITGVVLYVEAVDPDGDGDAHYVLIGGDITAPGLSVIDVERDLRPRRLPRPGDTVSAAGPVFTGSHGQRQIEAVVVHQRRALR
jgi:hypothetical protein